MRRVPILLALLGPLSGCQLDELLASDDNSQVVAPIPTLTWSACANVHGAECTTAAVPLDYGDPNGPTIELALIKYPAKDPARRIGSLFTNPGGPGGSGVEGASYFVDLLGDEVLARFDLIGIDPRGVAGSEALACPELGGMPPAAPTVAYPRTAAEQAAHLAYDAYLLQRCANANRIIDHMSTADTARDLDLIRQAVGDDKLTYYAVSYGSYLGATYAAMFPDRVRALAVDGVLDPVAWAGTAATAGTPFTVRIESHPGAQETLLSALAKCDEVGTFRCPLAGNAYKKWDRVRRSLLTEPVELPGVSLREQNFVSLTMLALYAPDAYPALAAVTALIDLVRFGPFPPQFAPSDPDDDPDDDEFDPEEKEELDGYVDEIVAKAGPFASPLPSVGAILGHRSDAELAFNGVGCADAVNPTVTGAWATAAGAADATAPGFGPARAWSSSICAAWPGSSDDAYRGPFTVTTATPVLIINSTYDPATPISGARALHALLPTSRMIEVTGWGHTSITATSSCLRQHAAAYLIDQTVPPANVTCAADNDLFPPLL